MSGGLTQQIQRIPSFECDRTVLSTLQLDFQWLCLAAMQILESALITDFG